MNDLETINNDILELESKLKESNKNKNNLILKELKEELIGKYIVKPELMFKIEDVSLVYENNKWARLKGTAIAFGSELMISSNFNLDYDFERKASHKELDESVFNEKYKFVLKELSKGYE